MLDSRHAARIQIGRHLALEPLPVLHKIIQRHRPGKPDTALCLVLIERQGVIRIRNV